MLWSYDFFHDWCIANILPACFLVICFLDIGVTLLSVGFEGLGLVDDRRGRGSGMIGGASSIMIELMRELVFLLSGCDS